MKTEPKRDIKPINLHSVETTPEIMQKLEDLGLIYRLCPSRHALNAKEGEILEPTLYPGDKRFGPHQLIALTLNRNVFDSFGTHPDNEEFLLIGDPNTRPLYLVIALCKRDELELKISESALQCDDFLTLRLRFNDPEVSFFTMLKNVPHGEAAGISNAKPPSFYVTRSAGFDVDFIDIGNYELRMPGIQRASGSFYTPPEFILR